MLAIQFWARAHWANLYNLMSLKCFYNSRLLFYRHRNCQIQLNGGSTIFFFLHILGHGYGLVKMEVVGLSAKKTQLTRVLGGTGRVLGGFWEYQYVTFSGAQWGWNKESNRLWLFFMNDPSAQLLERCIDTSTPFPQHVSSAGSEPVPISNLFLASPHKQSWFRARQTGSNSVPTPRWSRNKKQWRLVLGQRNFNTLIWVIILTSWCGARTTVSYADA